MYNPPFTVIGYYKPTKYRGGHIGRYLTKFTKKMGLKPLVDGVHGAQTTSIWSDEALHAEVRRFAQFGEGSSWHQDGDQAPGSTMDHAAVLWANKTPTEFSDCLSPAKVWRPQPFEIVIARNLDGFHRSPPDCPKKPERRWFFRQRIDINSMEAA